MNIHQVQVVDIDLVGKEKGCSSLLATNCVGLGRTFLTGCNLCVSLVGALAGGNSFASSRKTNLFCGTKAACLAETGLAGLDPVSNESAALQRK